MLRLLSAAYGDGPVSPRSVAILEPVEPTSQGTRVWEREFPADTLAFLVSYFPTRESLRIHVESTPSVDDLWLIPEAHASGVQPWETYCLQVERNLCQADDNTNNRQSIFGMCRRCGSARLLVTTRQLRRADEGMTEIRRCKDCGHISKVNS